MRTPQRKSTARDYFPILLWHLTCRPIALFWLPAFDAAIVATAAEGRLILHDMISARPFDLAHT